MERQAVPPDPPPNGGAHMLGVLRTSALWRAM